jgi:Spy/CpxP family protein refolding chaperone
MKKLIWLLAGLWWAGLGHAGPPPEIMRRALLDAGLSREQVARIQDIIFQAEKEKVELKYRLESARLELQRLLEVAQPDKKAVFEKLEQIGRLEVELRKNRLGLMLDIRALMTPEQWEKVEKFHRVWMKDKYEKEREQEEPPAP